MQRLIAISQPRKTVCLFARPRLLARTMYVRSTSEILLQPRLSSPRKASSTWLHVKRFSKPHNRYSVRSSTTILITEYSTFGLLLQRFRSPQPGLHDTNSGVLYAVSTTMYGLLLRTICAINTLGSGLIHQLRCGAPYPSRTKVLRYRRTLQ